jgi:hypothetical protein
MKYKFLRIFKRRTSKVVEISEDGKTWVSLEKAFGFVQNSDFNMEFALADVCSIETIK